MVVSGVFANKEAIGAFVTALDVSAHDPKRKPVEIVKLHLTDHAEIKVF